MVSFIALIAGIIFGFGIIGSGMVNPTLVLAFLDVTGDWDATLLWVMGGAVTGGTVAFMLARKREQSYLGLPMQIPGVAKVDSRLLLGSLLFGIGCGALQAFVPGRPWY